MKFSEQWLREWVNPDLTTEELIAQLTMAGLEVEAFESVCGAFDEVLVAEVLQVAAHPNADKLSLCEVSTGEGDPKQIICGAPNVRKGLKAPFAPVGATVNDMKIKKVKLRGVESFGMLCSERELGISDNHEGLLELPDDAPVGEKVRDYLKLDDNSIDLDLTPNRSDCLGIVGLAREVGVLNNLDVREPEQVTVGNTINDVFPVSLTAKDACPRYVGRVINNIDVNAKTPLWLKERLRRCDLRSIDPVVDVTNFVMLELGQPMHAFDRDRLADGIVVRRSIEDETIVLLDGKEIELNEDTLLITDGSGPIAIAGVMGGLATAVTGETRNIFLESAFFSPIALTGKARSYGLNTDAAHRFERGVDHAVQVAAIERATDLLLEITGGEAGPVTEVVSEEHLPQESQVRLRSSRISRLLGIDVSEGEIDEILTRLGLPYEKEPVDSGASWSVSSPSHRFDIALGVDLIEEISRIYGYNRLPVTVPKADLNMSHRTEAQLTLSDIRRQLVARGYQEAITNSFVDDRLENLLDPANEPIPLANPLSADLSVMRTSLWPGLIKSLIYNKNRQQDRVRLFETGLRFIQPPNREQIEFEEIQQDKVLAGVACGPRSPEVWSNQSEGVDFFDVKGDVESILTLTGSSGEFAFEMSTHPALHPGQTAAIRRDKQLVGYVGLLHPQLQGQLDLKEPVYLFEFALDLLIEGKLPEFTELSKFPEIRRDLAIIVDRSVLAADIRACVHENAGNWLRNLKLFDVYQGKGIDPNRKSVALGLTFQHPSRTLTDEDIGNSINLVVAALQDRFEAVLRN
jgi:phenylalanyl-tRNA synthetase beta chain